MAWGVRAANPGRERGTGTHRRRTAAAARVALRWSPATIPIDARRSLQVLDVPDQLEDLRACWDALTADYRGPANHIDWAISTARVGADDTRLCVLVLRVDGRCAAIAPLIQLADDDPGRLRLINRDDASGFLYTDQESLDVLVDAVLGLHLPLALKSLVEGSATERAVRRRSTGLLRASRTWVMGSSIRVDERLADPLALLSATRRNGIRRRLRKAEGMGAVSFRVDGAREDLDTQFDEFVRLESSGWKGRAGSGLAAAHAQREAFRAFVCAPAVRGLVRFARLTIDDAPIAIELAFVMDDRVWTLKSGYDEDYAAASPGMLATVELMKWAVDQGVERYEFMGSMDDLKRPWGDGPMLRQVRIYPPTPRGLLALSADALEAARWAERRLRPGVQRAIGDVATAAIGRVRNTSRRSG